MSAATRKSSSSRRRSTRRPATSRRSTTRPPARRRRRTVSRTTRRRPTLATTIGAALGTLAVSFMLDASWPVRIGLVALVIVVGLGWLLWQARTGAPTPAQPTGADGAGTPETSPAAYGNTTIDPKETTDD